MHAADHARQGMDIVLAAVIVTGITQIALAAVTVGVMFRGSRLAPHAAIVIGFVSAAGFAAAHLLPTWGFFSDSFINAPSAARVHLVLLGDSDPGDPRRHHLWPGRNRSLRARHRSSTGVAGIDPGLIRANTTMNPSVCGH